jgi:hypothetical protein
MTTGNKKPYGFMAGPVAGEKLTSAKAFGWINEMLNGAEQVIIFAVPLAKIIKLWPGFTLFWQDSLK